MIEGAPPHAVVVDDGSRWYAVHTQPHREFRAKKGTFGVSSLVMQGEMPSFRYKRLDRASGLGVRPPCRPAKCVDPAGRIHPPSCAKLVANRFADLGERLAASIGYRH